MNILMRELGFYNYYLDITYARVSYNIIAMMPKGNKDNTVTAIWEYSYDE